MNRTDQMRLTLPSTSPREAYLHIRNYLAGSFVGATRDETLVSEVVKCVFCRALMNRRGGRPSDDAIELAGQYRATFADLKGILPAVFTSTQELMLDPVSLQVVDSYLSLLDFDNPSTDPIGDVYESFIGSAARGSAGQFFTPQAAVRFLVDLVDPRPGETVIDPACGAGSFLSFTARHLIAGGADPGDVSGALTGIDKDRYLCDLAAAHVGLVTFAPTNIYCADSLAWKGAPGDAFLSATSIGTFDVVLTNPPFGAKIVASSEDVQRDFQLGYKWKATKSGRYDRTQQLATSVPPQVLFVERCLALVRPGGRVGMVVPESMISGKNYRYVVQHIRDNARITAVVGMPENLFKTAGSAGTHTKTCLLVLEKHESTHRNNFPLFMAEAHWCGHDSRGRQIERDDLPLIRERINDFHTGRPILPASHLGYEIAQADLIDNILAPRYYDPDTKLQLDKLAATHDLMTVRNLVDAGLLEVKTGDEVGKLAYSDAGVPFVRTSDISNWELKLDPKQRVSDDVYDSLKIKQDVRENDILMVRDGTYLIGSCAFITEYDTRIVYQSHIYKIRCVDPERLSPFLLLAALSCPPVRAQIAAKRFTQDIIDSLGDRLYELVLPLPRDPRERTRITRIVEKSIGDRTEARELARQARLEIAGLPNGVPISDDLDLLPLISLDAG